MIGNKKHNYEGKCGSCIYFDFYVRYVRNGGDTRSFGKCNNINRKSYHDASQKACKLYQKEAEE